MSICLCLCKSPGICVLFLSLLYFVHLCLFRCNAVDTFCCLFFVVNLGVFFLGGGKECCLLFFCFLLGRGLEEGVIFPGSH